MLGVSVKPSKGNKKFVHSRLMVAGPDIVAFRHGGLFTPVGVEEDLR